MSGSKAHSGEPGMSRFVPMAWMALTTTCLGLACATGPLDRGAPPPPAESSERVIRPESGAEYDVLVAELAAQAGEFQLARDAFGRAAKKDPESAPIQISLARLAARAQDIPAALTHAERGFFLDPGHVESRLFLARLYRIQNRSWRAREVLLDESGLPFDDTDAKLLLYQIELESDQIEAALRVGLDLLAAEPDLLAAFMAVATAYERLGQEREAEWILRDALDAHRNRLVVFARLSQIRRESGDREAEIVIYGEVLAEYPGHYGTLMSLSEAQIALNDFDGAIETYEKALNFFPDDLQTLRRVASLEFGSGRYRAAEARLRDALARFPEKHEFNYSLGRVLRAMAEPAEAIRVFDRVPVSHPLHIEARMEIALLFQAADRWDEALEEVNAIRVLRPNRGLDFHAASLHARVGDFAAGLAILQSLLEKFPSDVDVLYQLGVFYGIEGEVERALYYMHEVLSKNPDDARALNYIGYVWAERGENLDEAERMIRKAVRLSPGDGYIVDSLGWVYYMRARPLAGEENSEQRTVLLEKAVIQLDLAMELTGGDPVVSEHLGDVYLLLDQKERALDYYEGAVELRPRLGEQPDLGEKLDRLRMDIGLESLQQGEAESR